MSKNRLTNAKIKSYEGLKYYLFSPTGNKKASCRPTGGFHITYNPLFFVTLSWFNSCRFGLVFLVFLDRFYRGVVRIDS